MKFLLLIVLIAVIMVAWVVSIERERLKPVSTKAAETSTLKVVDRPVGRTMLGHEVQAAAQAPANFIQRNKVAQ